MLSSLFCPQYTTTHYNFTITSLKEGDVITFNGFVMYGSDTDKQRADSSIGVHFAQINVRLGYFTYRRD